MKRVHVVILQVVLFLSIATILSYTFSAHEFVAQNVARVQSVLKPADEGGRATATVYRTVTLTPPSPTWSNTYPLQTYPPAVTTKEPDKSYVTDHGKQVKVEGIVRAILDPADESVNRTICPSMNEKSLKRYDYLRGKNQSSQSQSDDENPKILPKYFFALDLYNCVDLLATLLSATIEAIRFLGPEDCVLSIIEGRSDDGTYEALSHSNLRTALSAMNLTYHLGTNEIDTKAADVDRIAALSDLRNQALDPLLSHPSHFSPQTSIIFLNDIHLCPIDILELVHKKQHLGATHVCAMDWDDFNGLKHYDIWTSRQLNGEMFIEMPQNGNWEYAHNLFYADPTTKARYDRRAPLQVFSCWNGVTVFDAAPFVDAGVRFRGHREGECELGEPVNLDKDFWIRGFGRVAVVPSVNVAYNEEDMKKVIEEIGNVEAWYDKDETGVEEVIEKWKTEPPRLLKCVDPGAWSSEWRDWDEGL